MIILARFCLKDIWRLKKTFISFICYVFEISIRYLDIGNEYYIEYL